MSWCSSTSSSNKYRTHSCNTCDHEPFDEGWRYPEDKHEETNEGNFYSFFNNLDALHTHRKLCDLVVQVEDQTFFCHKIILAASSEYFNGLLGGDFQDSKQDQIRLDMMSAKAFNTILSYMYNRRINIKDKNATELLVASDFLGMDYVYKLCYQHIVNSYTTIPVENVLEVFQFFLITRELDIHFISLLCKYLAYNRSVLSGSSFFIEMSSLVWNSVLRIVDLQQTGNEIVEAIIRWVNYKFHDRKVHLMGMIELIKFGTTNAPYLKVLEKFAADCNQSDVISTSRKLIPSNATSNSSLHMFFTFEGNHSSYSGIVALDHKLEWKCYSTKNEITYTDGNETHHRKLRIRNRPYNKRSVSGKSLYHVQYNENKRRYNGEERIYFLCSSLRNMNKRISLKRPPITVAPTRLCSVHDKVYLYYQGEDEYRDCLNHPDFTADELTRNNIFLYRSERDTWFSIPVPPVATKNSILVSCDNILYLLGDSGVNGSRNRACRYDSRRRNWEILPSMRYTYKAPRACECNGKIYICSVNSSNKAECYDPVANKWAGIARNEKMSNEGCEDEFDGLYNYFELASHNNLVWALENNANSNPCSNTVDVYNPKTNRWSNFKSPAVAMRVLGNDECNYYCRNYEQGRYSYYVDDFINITS